MATVTLTGLPRQLVQRGVVEEALMQQVLEEATRRKVTPLSLLVEEKKVSARAVAEVAALEFGLPLLDLDGYDLGRSPSKDVPAAIIRKHTVLPLFKRGRRIFVGLSDPTNIQALDEIKFTTGLQVDAVLVEGDKLQRAIATLLEAADAAKMNMDLDAGLENIEFEDTEDDNSALGDEGVEDAPVVKFVNKILLDAINLKASDIHMEPYEKDFRVRMRIDGMLHEKAKAPKQISDRLIARVKVMSRMDLAERRKPQDGRIKLKLSATKSIDFRVNTLPTLFGEKVVLRILDASSAKLGIDALGFEPDQKELYLKNLARPQGMILVTGPTGSGKTVTLYTGLNILNTPDINISTAEDPAEIVLHGVNQVNVNAKVGLTFADALRSFLRQDPDVVMVGEIRDLETAEIAIKAAQTGHLVLSTLHTNDAPQTINRLMNMGVAYYNIASTVSLIIAQRLGRRLCTHCKIEDKVPPEALLQEGFTEEDIASGMRIYKANPDGCERCTAGYKGRVGFYQVMPISETMQDIILRGGSVLELSRQAKAEGVRDLRTSGLWKVKQGVTSLEECNSITVD